MKRIPAAAAAAAVAVALALALPACDGNGDDGLRPTMANLWPHADQSAWTYETVLTELVRQTVPSLTDALPSLTALHADLEGALDGTVAGVDSAFYTFALDGVDTTDSGAVGQRVVETIEPLDGGASVPAPPDRRLLRLLALARPDLRPRVLARLGEPEVAWDPRKDFAHGVPPLLLGGGPAYAYEDSGYYSYGDVDLGHSWVYLEAPPRPGTEYSLQLVPALADDVWLHGRVWSVRDRAFGGVRYANVVECLLVIDLGVETVTDEQGQPLGDFRSYIYGRIFYAPATGPVAFQERHVLFVRTAYEPGGSQEPVRWETAGTLLEAVLPDVP